MRVLALGLLTVAAALAATSVEQYKPHDFAFRAQVAGNPFAVELTGEFAGPGGKLMRVPGFYDGDGTWKIRFGAPEAGKWRLKTSSPVAALHGKVIDDIEAAPNRHPKVHGALKVDAANPHHFRYADGTRFFLLGYECDWLWAPPRSVQETMVRQMTANGFNYVVVNIYAHDTKWAEGKTNEWDYGPAPVFAFGGTNEKPDHTRMNTAFFQSYDKMMDLLRDNGIVAHIFLKVYNKLVNWPERGSVEEERYFRYITARYQAYSNVVWDYSKESYNEKDKELLARLIGVVRAADGHGHLLTVHDDNPFAYDPAYNHLTDFRTDQLHNHWAAGVALDRSVRAWPAVNLEFGYEQGVEDLPTYRVKQNWEEVLRRAYIVYFAGGYGAYYYSNTAWDLLKPEPEPPGMKRYKVLADVFESLPYWRMAPRNELGVGGPVLALDGEVYAAFVEGEKLTLNLTNLDGAGSVEWVDTWNGKRETAGEMPPGVQFLTKPAGFGKAPGVVIVRRKKG